MGTFRVDDVSVRELPLVAIDTTFWTPPRAVKKSRMSATLFEPGEAHMLDDVEGDADLDDECEAVPEDDSDNDELQDTWQIKFDRLLTHLPLRLRHTIALVCVIQSVGFCAQALIFAGRRSLRWSRRRGRRW